jgi:hypothetical protein
VPLPTGAGHGEPDVLASAPGVALALVLVDDVDDGTPEAVAARWQRLRGLAAGGAAVVAGSATAPDDVSTVRLSTATCSPTPVPEVAR